jgi:hypothetical protein
MTGVEQLAFELVLEQVEHRPPVDAAKLADLLPSAGVIIRDAHVRGDLGLVDVEHRATLDQAFSLMCIAVAAKSRSAPGD